MTNEPTFEYVVNGRPVSSQPQSRTRGGKPKKSAALPAWRNAVEQAFKEACEFRRGRSAKKRLALGRAIVDTCVELLGVPRRTVMVEFTPHAGEEILRDGNWTGDWTRAEAVTG
jgi:hypothetical protein